ncbi:MAG: adenylate/guanylate cyclase domain-containing protein, partial [Desulfobacteraceae bacterium]
VLEGRTLGWVYGGAGARVAVDLIMHLAHRELERRSLAAETLERYKELHLLHRLSESISSRLELSEVAGVILNEAMGSVQATSSSLMLADESDGFLRIVAAVGTENQEKTLLKRGRGIAGHVLSTGVPEIVNNAPADPRFKPGRVRVHSLMCAPLKSKDRVFGVINMSNERPKEYTAQDLTLLTTLAGQAASAVENALLHEKRIQQERVRGNLERYVAPQIVETIMAEGGDASLQPQSRHIAVLFSDIRGFSSTCEALAPEEVVRHLNKYFTAMVEEIFNRNGTVNKFVGDMIVALFGAPVSAGGEEETALETAVAMQRRIQTIDDPWIRSNFHTGMGVSSGLVVVGNIGSPSHLDYTAIGDEVNVAARLQAEARGGQILVSRAVKEAAGERFRFLPMGMVPVKGRSRPVEVFEVIY